MCGGQRLCQEGETAGRHRHPASLCSSEVTKAAARRRIGYVPTHGSPMLVVQGLCSLDGETSGLRQGPSSQPRSVVCCWAAGKMEVPWEHMCESSGQSAGQWMNDQLLFG